jgi:hypothetical protein
MHNPSLLYLLYVMLVHLCVGVGWKLDALWFSLTRIPCYPVMD